MHAAPHRVDPDGLTLAHADVAVWAPVAADARCIDLLGCPDLARVDLRACGGASALHLTTRDCPRLAEILLPEGRGGAVLHLDLGALGAPVVVHGPLASVDGCYGRAGRFASENGPHRSAWIGRDTGAALADTGFVVHIGNGGGARERCVVPPEVREAMVLDHPDLTSIEVVPAAEPAAPAAWRASRTLHIEGCRRLTRITAPGGLRTLRVAGARALVEIDAAGASAHLARGTADAEALHLRGDWEHIGLADSPLRALHGTLAQCVEVTSCPNLHTIQLLTPRLQVTDAPRLAHATGAHHVAVDAESLRRALESGQAPRPAMAEAMVTHLLEQRGPRQGCAALQALHTVAPVLPPQRSWDLRERIAARHHVGPGWRWQFEDLDLAQRGLDADLDLWWDLRASVPAARDHDARIASTGHAEGIAALLDWRALHPDRSEVLDALLLRALTMSVTREDAQVTDRALGRTRAASLERIAHRLLRSLDRPGTRALLDAFPRWTAERYASSATLDLLAALASASHDASRHRLNLVYFLLRWFIGGI